MQIKEVCAATGLSAKSIRFYEEKGLLAVDRNADNSYRNYSDADVIRLKEIRILRHFGLSVQEISDFFAMSREDARAFLLQLEQRTEEDLSQRQDSLELLRSFRKDYGSSRQVVEEYSKTITLLGDEEASGVLRDIKCPSLAQTIFQSLILLGPIGSLLIHIGERQWHGMWWLAAASLAAAALLVLNWQAYLAGRKGNRTYVREKNRSTRYLYLLLPMSVVAGILLIVCFGSAQEKLLAPEGWLFHQMPWWAEVLMIFAVLLPVMYALTWLLQLLAKQKAAGEDSFPLGYRFVIRHRRWMIPVWVLCLYLAFTSTTFVTEDALVVHTPLCPAGTRYGLEEVEQVAASFGSKGAHLAPYRRAGEFSYTVTVAGREIVFSVDSANGEIARYENDSYLWLEELDDRLMALGVPKTTDNTCAGDCQLSEQCVAHYRHIMENQPASAVG